LVRVDTEGQEEECQASSDEENADDVKLNGVVLERLPESALGLAPDDEARGLGLPVVVPEDQEERRADDRSDDGEGSKPPPEATGRLEEGSRKRAANPNSGDVGRVDEGKGEGPVLEGRGIGNEDTTAVGDSVIAGFAGTVLVTVRPY